VPHRPPNKGAGSGVPSLDPGGIVAAYGADSYWSRDGDRDRRAKGVGLEPTAAERTAAVFRFDGPRSGVCTRVRTLGFIGLSMRAGAGVFGSVGTGCGMAHAVAPMTASKAAAASRCIVGMTCE